MQVMDGRDGKEKLSNSDRCLLSLPTMFPGKVRKRLRPAVFGPAPQALTPVTRQQFTHFHTHLHMCVFGNVMRGRGRGRGLRCGVLDQPPWCQWARR